MKILLNALPRTKSKWLCLNIKEYLTAKYKFTSNLIIGNRLWPLTDWFTKKEEGLLIPGHIIKGHQLFLHSLANVNIDEELQSRLNILLNCQTSISIKIHPTSWHEVIAIHAISPVCDRYYTLRRRDIIDLCISTMVCEHTDIWQPGPELNLQISKYLDKPFIVDPTDFISKLNLLKMQNEYLDQQETAIHLYAEDMTNITNSRDFCNYLQLPYVDFKLDQFFGPEYRNTKSLMIKNYDQLMDIATSYFKNNNPARFL